MDSDGDNSDGDNDSDFDYDGHYFVMPLEMKQRGLELLGFTERQLTSSNENRNQNRFKSSFGASPTTLCTIYEDLQTTNLIIGEESTLKWFLIALHFLKRYPTETERENIFNVSERSARNNIWNMIESIRSLKEIKITWPDNLGSDDIWIMSVDGTHCWIAEPQHPIWSQDTSYFSHKYSKAGIDYELGIVVHRKLHITYYI